MARASPSTPVRREDPAGELGRSLGVEAGVAGVFGGLLEAQPGGDDGVVRRAIAVEEIEGEAQAPAQIGGAGLDRRVVGEG